MREATIVSNYLFHHIYPTWLKPNSLYLLQLTKEHLIPSPCVSVPLPLVFMTQCRFRLVQSQFSPVRRIGRIGSVELITLKCIDGPMSRHIHDELPCADSCYSIIHQVLMRKREESVNPSIGISLKIFCKSPVLLTIPATITCCSIRLVKNKHAPARGLVSLLNIPDSVKADIINRKVGIQEFSNPHCCVCLAHAETIGSN